MSVRPRLSLNRETLHCLTPNAIGQIQGGGNRADIVIYDSSIKAICSVGTGSIGNSLGCTSAAPGCGSFQIPDPSIYNHVSGVYHG